MGGYRQRRVVVQGHIQSTGWQGPSSIDASSAGGDNKWNSVQGHDDMRPVTTTGTELMATRNVMLEQMKDMRLGRIHLQRPAWFDLAESTHGC